MQDKLVKYQMRCEYLKHFLAGDDTNCHIPTGLKPGEKYKPPKIKKRKNEKKTWKKF